MQCMLRLSPASWALLCILPPLQSWFSCTMSETIAKHTSSKLNTNKIHIHLAVSAASPSPLTCNVLSRLPGSRQPWHSNKWFIYINRNNQYNELKGKCCAMCPGVIKVLNKSVERDEDRGSIQYGVRRSGRLSPGSHHWSKPDWKRSSNARTKVSARRERREETVHCKPQLLYSPAHYLLGTTPAGET